MKKISTASTTLTIPMGSAFAHTSEHGVDMELLTRSVQEAIQSDLEGGRVYLQIELSTGKTVNALYCEDTVIVSSVYVETETYSAKSWRSGFEAVVRRLLVDLGGAKDAVIFINGEAAMIGI